MLIFFTSLTFFCLSKFHAIQKKSFSLSWWFWLISMGLSIGCVCSIKLVGLFTTALIGVYTIVDLWYKFSYSRLSIKSMMGHFISRVFGLIIIPILVFALCFKLHFQILLNSGASDTHMSSLFQANLVGSSITKGPYDVGYSSLVTLHTKSDYGGLLHSHVQMYQGTDKQQITVYNHKDQNNDWIIQKLIGNSSQTFSEGVTFLENGSAFRLVHFNTSNYLGVNDAAAPITKNHKQVTADMGSNTTTNSTWLVEIVKEIEPIKDGHIHPITTSFRLKNLELSCYLTVTGSKLPKWGFGQGEVTCNPNFEKSDKGAIWNVEHHSNNRLPTIENRQLPKSNFLDDIINLNIAMMATNNGLIPDPDKLDDLASSAWEWPLLHTGLRMNAWVSTNYRYYLLEHPLVLWGSSVSLVIFTIISCYYAIRWQRSYTDFTPEEGEHFMIGGALPLIGWGLHYLPFMVMARVTYVHHYLPALYFAIFVLGSVVEHMSCGLKNRTLKLAVFLLLYTIVIYVFRLFSPISYGMVGDCEKFFYLRWIKNWKI
ncbi:hypothetical protein NADFUDRAFT_81897 [Nadsonia fulvescens var. elongata DSM 6958]|uniref:Dolichyl-phosphate-mannose--protein mannosyltransferase n=1 Tax=Nadsonia fulvescens var. elongata DSM 6958 TaxID=857566 RepID=A0A1E3PPQ5_9ASCO|nr:hypothetical protein NADFUDRAFT_81897 [Nadsonia fulvescens var. elongata DSM 6958]